MKIVVIVDCEIGEESIKISEVTPDFMNTINDLLLYIKKLGGYYPTGDYYEEGEMQDPELLYREFSSFRLLDEILPEPTHGFKKILEIHVFKEGPISLYM